MSDLRIIADAKPEGYWFESSPRSLFHLLTFIQQPPRSDLKSRQYQFA